MRDRIIGSVLFVLAAAAALTPCAYLLYDLYFAPN